MDKEDLPFAFFALVLILGLAFLMGFVVATSGVREWCDEAGRVSLGGQWYSCQKEK